MTHTHNIQDEIIEVLEPQELPEASPYSLLYIVADTLNDVEQLRIATDNRVRALTQVKGLVDAPETERMADYAQRLKDLEKDAIKDITKAMKAHPLGDFINRTVGLGLKQGARLLATIGPPADRENVGKLWAYCGYHVIQTCSVCETEVWSQWDAEGRVWEQAQCEDHPSAEIIGHSPVRRRGQKANWNNKARMRARLCAESCMKQRHSPYREVYEYGRRKYEDRTTGDLHKHNMALRLVAKELLLDLWIEDKKLRGEYEAIENDPNYQSHPRYSRIALTN
jgi:hypothetical protein